MPLLDNSSTPSNEPSNTPLSLNENLEIPSTSVYDPGAKPEINTQREVPNEIPFRELPKEI